MPDPVPTAEDFARAELVCSYLSENLQIQFQISGLEMSREDAVKHFNVRKALTIVQGLLIDAAERAAQTK